MRRILLALLPVVPGLVAVLLVALIHIDVPTIYLRARLDLFLLLVGSGVTCSIFIILWVRARFDKTRQIIQSEEAQGHRRFIQLLDHELKNPITAIKAGLSNLSLKHAENPDQPVLQSIENQVNRLSKLVSDLRKLSDLETRVLEWTAVNMNDLLSEAFEYASTQEAAQGRIFNLQIPQAPWPLPEIVGDRDLLFLAIANLLDNAIKFSKPGSTIELRASETNDKITVEIADTGPGIPASELADVWVELFRGENAHQIPGSGLGLALVHAIVARHHGSASIRSRTDQGTVVAITLPIGNVPKP